MEPDSLALLTSKLYPRLAAVCPNTDGVTTRIAAAAAAQRRNTDMREIPTRVVESERDRGSLDSTPPAPATRFRPHPPPRRPVFRSRLKSGRPVLPEVSESLVASARGVVKIWRTHGRARRHGRHFPLAARRHVRPRSRRPPRPPRARPHPRPRSEAHAGAARPLR